MMGGSSFVEGTPPFQLNGSLQVRAMFPKKPVPIQVWVAALAMGEASVRAASPTAMPELIFVFISGDGVWSTRWCWGGGIRPQSGGGIRESDLGPRKAVGGGEGTFVVVIRTCGSKCFWGAG